jgi:hypothetical protein
VYADGVKVVTVVWAALLLAGCYSPKLGDPGFFCHATDNPACPDGQNCVNGRCVVGIGSHHNGSNGDLGSGSGFDFGTGGQRDFSTGGHPDLSQPPNNGGLTGCLGELMCVNNCPATSQTCPTDCQMKATPQGDSLFQALVNCVVAACPSDPGSVCDGTDSTACDNCVMSAQDTGGQCSSQQMACANSTP